MKLLTTAAVLVALASPALAGGLLGGSFSTSSYGGNVGAGWGSESVAVGNGLNLSFGAAHSEGSSGAQSCFIGCGGTGSGYAGGKAVTGAGSLSLGYGTGMGFGQAAGNAGAHWNGGPAFVGYGGH